jgi:hypothetical protein
VKEQFKGVGVSTVETCENMAQADAFTGCKLIACFLFMLLMERKLSLQLTEKTLHRILLHLYCILTTSGEVSLSCDHNHRNTCGYASQNHHLTTVVSCIGMKITAL